MMYKKSMIYESYNITLITCVCAALSSQYLECNCLSEINLSKTTKYLNLAMYMHNTYLSKHYNHHPCQIIITM